MFIRGRHYDFNCIHSTKILDRSKPRSGTQTTFWFVGIPFAILDVEHLGQNCKGSDLVQWNRRAGYSGNLFGIQLVCMCENPSNKQMQSDAAMAAPLI